MKRVTVPAVKTGMNLPHFLYNSPHEVFFEHQ